MNSLFREGSISSLAAVAVLTCLLAGCSDSEPSAPTTGPRVTAVTLSSSSVAGGTTLQGTVTLSAAPTTATTVALSSNNASATVPGNVTVNSGARTATFTVNTSVVASTTAVIISATLNGATQTAALSLTAASDTASLISLTISVPEVPGGSTVQGTVTLGTAATSAVTVALASSHAAAIVPPTVTVNAGSSTATFNIATGTVTASTDVIITATLNGASRTAPLKVRPAAPAGPVARFTVTSLSAAQRKTASDPAPVTLLPAGSADACPLVNDSDPRLDCRFDGATSSGTIALYIWTYSFGTKQQTETTTTPQLTPTASGCGFFAGQSSSSSDGQQFIEMRVDLQVRDTAGNTSSVVSNHDVRIYPASRCGYGF